MEAPAKVPSDAELALRVQVLAVLDDLCRDLTLRDVREWYAESMADRF